MKRKFCFWVYLALVVATMVMHQQVKATASSMLSIGINVVTAIGLCGFAFRQPLISREFWKVWSSILLFGEAVSVLSNPNFWKWPALIFAGVFIWIEVWAIRKYAYRSPEIWTESLDPLNGGPVLFVLRWGEPPRQRNVQP